MAFTYNGQSFDTVRAAREAAEAERIEEEAFAAAAEAERGYERFLETNDQYAYECDEDERRAGAFG